MSHECPCGCEFMSDVRLQDHRSRCKVGPLIEERDDLKRKLSDARDHLVWMLPMAKGYESDNRVGRNEEILRDAEAFIKTYDYQLDQHNSYPIHCYCSTLSTDNLPCDYCEGEVLKSAKAVHAGSDLCGTQMATSSGVEILCPDPRPCKQHGK